MESNEELIIVIGRKFGAGGRAIGKALSERLGIPYYDNELLKAAAIEFGFDSKIFANVDERKPSFFKKILTRGYGVQETFMPDTLGEESIYEAQSKVIRAVAKKGPCIIVGRTADYILRDFPGLVSVFLHAPESFRAGKIAERGDALNMQQALELARKKDKEREAYYRYFSGRPWGSASNYNLCLDSSMLNTDQAAELIISYIKTLKEEKKS